MTDVHVVLPGDIDDPLRPSGGNRYDRRICRGLAAIGWSVHEHQVPGGWPVASPAAREHLAGVLRSLPDGALVVADGLVASATPAEMAPAADRLRLVVLVHMPLGAAPSPYAASDSRAAEHAVLSASAAVVATSHWTRSRLHELYSPADDRLHVVQPGVEPAELAPGTAGGGELLCVAAVTPAKGHDVLIAALAMLRDLSWRCAIAGSLELRPGFVAGLRSRAGELGIADRLRFAGPLTGTALDGTYAAADVLVLPSRAETYGMVITEALARGLPVVASAVGGVPEAVGRSPDGAPPGTLVPAGDPEPLAYALRRWLTDEGHRHRLRAAARSRRPTLTHWSTSAARMSHILATVAAEPGAGGARITG